VEEKTQSTVEPFDIEGIKKKIPKAFQGYIEPIIQWAKSVEERLQVMEDNLPEKVASKLQEMAIQRQKEQVAAYQQTAQNQPQQQGGFNLGGIEQFAGPIIKDVLGGGGRDEEMNNLTKEMFKMNIEGMKEDISFTKALKSAMLSKYATNLVKEVAP